MRFIIAKPNNRMSFGDLFYSVPSEEAEKQAFAELEELCKIKTQMKTRVDAELEVVQKTNNAFGVLIMHEIAMLSKELGYPTALFGIESGLYIMELLGISNIRTADYFDSEIPSEMCINEMLFSKWFGFALAIAEPIREQITRRLDERFGHIEANNEIYRNINLPSWDVLEQIGKLAAATKEPFNRVLYSSPDLLKIVFNNICENDLKQNTYLQDGYRPLELARLYAFARCNHGEDVMFSDVRNYVLRDDVYSFLRKNGCIAPEALRLSKNRYKGIRKETDIELIQQYDIPQNLLYCYNVLGNLWNAASCLTRINAFAMLKYYELKYSKEYAALCNLDLPD